MAKILVIEDNEDLAQVVRTFLIFEHYEVESVFDGREGLQRVKTYEYDLVVLDLGLPDMSGLEILKALRSKGSKTPVLILTGQDAIEEKERGLDAGADDYVTKPFHMKELGARIRAILRRPAPLKDSEILSASGITMDVTKFKVTKDGQSIQLLPREFQLLEFFMRHPNQSFSSEVLISRVWQGGTGETESAQAALRTTMRRLRKKIDPDGALIKTVHGVGYILESAESATAES